MPIDTVFLDAGGVLVRPSWTRVARVLAGHGIGADPIRLGRAELEAMAALDDPALVRDTDDDDRWSRFFRDVFVRAGLGRVPDAALTELRALHDRENLWATAHPEVPAVLARLAGRYRLVVVSNANGTIRASLEALGLVQHLDHVLDSFEEQVEKPDPRFFRIALERASARPERTVHVGDLFHVDVVGARSAGILGVLVDRAGLLAGADCPCFPDLEVFADALEAGRLG